MTSTGVTSTSGCTTSMLSERLGRKDGFTVACTVPVRLQLVDMKLGPLHDEPEGSGRQPADDHLAAEAHGRLVVPVPRVEVGLSMDALVEVHPDRDAVEEADPRHQARTGTADAGSGANARRSAGGSRAAALPARRAAVAGTIRRRADRNQAHRDDRRGARAGTRAVGG